MDLTALNVANGSGRGGRTAVSTSTERGTTSSQARIPGCAGARSALLGAQRPGGQTPAADSGPFAWMALRRGPARVAGRHLRSLCMDPRGVVVVRHETTECSATRASSATALEHVANRPIAEHVLEEMGRAGVREVVITCATHQAGEVRDALAPRERSHGLRLRFVESDRPLNLNDALGLIAPLVGGAPCIMHLGSGLLGEPLTPLVAQLQNGSPDMILVVHQHPAPEEQLSTATLDLLHVADLHPDRASLGMTGVWLFGPGAVCHVGEVAARLGTESDVTMMAECVAAAGGNLRVRLADSWRDYRGDPVHLLELNHIALDRLNVNRRVNGSGSGHVVGNGNRIEGRVWIDDAASVRASVIVGPAVIGAGAVVADAYIGPYTSIGAQARIEGAEIERSIIAAGASVTHIGERLAASVVGRNARILRDFSLPRALRVRVGDDTEIALC